MKSSPIILGLITFCIALIGCDKESPESEGPSLDIEVKVYKEGDIIVMESNYKSPNKYHQHMSETLDVLISKSTNKAYTQGPATGTLGSGMRNIFEEFQLKDDKGPFYGIHSVELYEGSTLIYSEAARSNTTK